MSEDRSPEHTITMTEGADDMIKAFVARVQETAAARPYCKDYEELAKFQKVVIDQTWSLLRTLTSLITSNPHDGDIRISPDGKNAMFFTYPKSGYSGGLILHENEDPTKASFSIHT